MITRSWLYSRTNWFCCGIMLGGLIFFAMHAFMQCPQYTKGQINAFQHVKYYCETGVQNVPSPRK